jgi:hypothetical protein
MGDTDRVHFSYQKSAYAAFIRNKWAREFFLCIVMFRIGKVNLHDRNT